MTRLRQFLKRLWLPVVLRVWPLAQLWYRIWGLTLDGRPDDRVWYFAYGANLNDSVFRGRRKMKPLEVRVGRVKGYRLRFNLHGRPRGRSAPANIEPFPGDEVWGVLNLMTRRDMVWLNATEGVPGWRYRPVWFDAVDTEGRTMAAFSLMAEGLSEDGNPSLRYITLIRDGARQHGLPPHWLQKLDQVRCAEELH